MFDDQYFNRQRFSFQYNNYIKWLRSLKNKKLAVIEIGAGSQIYSVRSECETLCRTRGISLIRINLNECKFDPDIICLRMKALDALQRLDKLIGE